MKKHISKKKWGQNFLIDPNVINKIISSINIKSTDSVLEIGPGKGAITIPLANKVKKMTAIEIDSNLCEILNNKNIPHLEIINDDILKIDLSQINSNIIVGNLPYYITTPILFKIFKSKLNWEKIYFLMQREVAERIVGIPKTKAYGRLTIMSQIFSNTKILFNISSQVFRPIPKVESSLVQFTKNSDFQINDYVKFEETIRKIFNQRRKKMKNCITSDMDLNLSVQSKLLDKRPEEITVQEYVKLIN